MPFTVAHVAAVLPAARVPALRDPLVASALAIGAMSPDAPYFVPSMSWAPPIVWSTVSHTATGMLLFCVPVTVALVALYWALLAAPLRALAPDGVRARLPRHVLAPHRDAPARALGLVLLGAALGAATHVVWDAITHAERWYPVLQYTSTVAGLGLLGWAAVRWYRQTPASAVAPDGVGWGWRLAFAGSVLLAGAMAWASALELLGRPHDLSEVHLLVLVGVVRSVAFMGLVAVLGATLLRFRSFIASP